MKINSRFRISTISGPKKKKKLSFKRVGVCQFHIGVPFNDGPCFKTTEDREAWEMGWQEMRAYYEGFIARCDGKAPETNPYNPPTGGTVNTDKNAKLAREWGKGYRVARFLF